MALLSRLPLFPRGKLEAEPGAVGLADLEEGPPLGELLGDEGLEFRAEVGAGDEAQGAVHQPGPRRG